MSAAIITAIIRPRSPVEGGNISLWLRTAGWMAPTIPSAHPQTGFGDTQLHPVAPGPPPSPGFAVGVTGEGAAWAKTLGNKVTTYRWASAPPPAWGRRCWSSPRRPRTHGCIPRGPRRPRHLGGQKKVRMEAGEAPRACQHPPASPNLPLLLHPSHPRAHCPGWISPRRALPASNPTTGTPGRPQNPARIHGRGWRSTGQAGLCTVGAITSSWAAPTAPRNALGGAPGPSTPNYLCASVGVEAFFYC